MLAVGPHGYGPRRSSPVCSQGGDRLPGRRIAALSAAAVAAIAAAGTAIAQPATIDWHEGFKSSDAAYNPTINTGESVTWNVTEGGHNVDVVGPENFKSTNGTDK